MKIERGLFYLQMILVFMRVIIYQDCKAGDPPFPEGARSAALSGLGLVLSDSWSAANNPAGLSDLKGFVIGLTAEQRFMMNELRNYSLVSSVGVGKGAFGLNFSYSGWDAYRQMKSGLSYAREFAPFFSSGLRLVYIRSNSTEAENADQWLSFDLGLMFRLSKHVNLAIEADNPLLTTLKNKEAIELPSFYQIGVAYEYNEGLILLAGIRKNSYARAEYLAGLEHVIFRKLALRAGVSMFPFRVSFGMGLKYKRLSLDIAASRHQYLGYSPQVSLLISISDPEK